MTEVEQDEEDPTFFAADVHDALAPGTYTDSGRGLRPMALRFWVVADRQARPGPHRSELLLLPLVLLLGVCLSALSMHRTTVTFHRDRNVRRRHGP